MHTTSYCTSYYSRTVQSLLLRMMTIYYSGPTSPPRKVPYRPMGLRTWCNIAADMAKYGSSRRTCASIQDWRTGMTKYRKRTTRLLLAEKWHRARRCTSPTAVQEGVPSRKNTDTGRASTVQFRCPLRARRASLDTMRSSNASAAFCLLRGHSLHTQVLQILQSDLALLF